jgi:hypothetical protein
MFTKNGLHVRGHQVLVVRDSVSEGHKLFSCILHIPQIINKFSCHKFICTFNTSSV